MITEAERHIAENKTRPTTEGPAADPGRRRGWAREERDPRRTQFLDRRQREDILQGLGRGRPGQLGVDGPGTGRQAAIYKVTER